MKKVILISLVLILLAVSVVPVMAANGASNGNGNGGGVGQGNGGGDQDRDQDQDREQNKLHKQDKAADRLASRVQNHTRMRTPFYLQGTIETIIAATDTITVTLVHGNAAVKQYIGTELTLLVPDGTPIFKIVQGGTETGTSTATGTNGNGTPGNRVPIPFEQLAVDQKVAIHGNLVNGVYIARLITVYIRAGETTAQNP